MKCADCKFWEKSALETNIQIGRGYCLRYPPQWLIDCDGDYTTIWPKTYNTDWCGEFVMKETPAE